MRFWDSSAVVPLLVYDSETPRVRSLYKDDPVIVAWWGTSVECASALARLEREARLEVAAATDAFRRLRVLQREWQEVQPIDLVRDTAFRLLRVHTLRAADALQLAAAFLVAENRPGSLDFVCLDQRLSLAAQREGLNVVGVA